MPDPTTDPTTDRTHPNWWHTAVVYQIYPRSFADSDGDGLGDLAGVRSRLGYLADLGIDAIWLSPFYPSPLADGGYDIIDHRAVDPRLGTLDDFITLVKDAHAYQLKVITDIVPNHTSEQHPWFRQALRSGPGSPERDRYIFRDGGGPDGSTPPTDWQSHFGGPAWHRVPDGQWYCHLFAREQPDLNWDNPEIRQYFLDTLRFWADLGVDGFRVDVAHSLAKDLSSPLRNQPNLDRSLPLDGSDPLYDRDEVHRIYRTWREVFDSYTPPKMAVAETWYPTNARTYLYARPSELGQVFDFSLLKAEWGRDTFRDVIRRSLHDHQAVGGGLTWVLSSHDVPRHPSRYALPPGVTPDDWLITDGAQPAVDPDVARDRGRAATLMMLALPGSAYLYQGEELGLLEVADLDRAALQDPVWERSGHTLKGRDGCRVPLPWTVDGPSFGFGPGSAWLPQPEWFAGLSVEAQSGDPDSTLALYKQALLLRRALNADDSGVDWIETDDPEVLHFARRNGWHAVVNFSDRPRPLPPGRVVLASRRLDGPYVPRDTTVWVTRP